ncbi:hypothetical protein D9M70_531520 [compost metagenome]
MNNDLRQTRKNAQDDHRFPDAGTTQNRAHRRVRWLQRLQRLQFAALHHVPVVVANLATSPVQRIPEGVARPDQAIDQIQNGLMPRHWLKKGANARQCRQAIALRFVTFFRPILGPACELCKDAGIFCIGSQRFDQGVALMLLKPGGSVFSDHPAKLCGPLNQIL